MNTFFVIIYARGILGIRNRTSSCAYAFFREDMLDLKMFLSRNNVRFDQGISNYVTYIYTIELPTTVRTLTRPMAFISDTFFTTAYFLI